MSFYGTKMIPRGARPWGYLEIAPHPMCELCTWVWAPDITRRNSKPFSLKYINRQCRLHGHVLPAGYI